MAERVKTPWTAQQVEALNAYQQLGYVHEFTCPNEHGEPGAYILRAAPDGWHCPRCDYAQDWAHDFMTDKTLHPPDPLHALRQKPD